MSRFAGHVIKKYGDTEKAYQTFLEEAAKCVPPLNNAELSSIWHSAQGFYPKLSQQDGYVAPEVYNDPSCYKPEDCSDAEQAEVLGKYFSSELRYSPITHFIRYSDHYWQYCWMSRQASAYCSRHAGGSRMNGSTVKQLSSNNDVFAEKKYKQPFFCNPCHTLMLYTNHLPHVSLSDDGIWHHRIVIPFNAKITSKSNIKNYDEYLFDNAGESILAWVIEVTKKVIELGYQIPVPACI